MKRYKFIALLMLASTAVIEMAAIYSVQGPPDCVQIVQAADGWIDVTAYTNPACSTTTWYCEPGTIDMLPESDTDMWCVAG